MLDRVRGRVERLLRPGGRAVVLLYHRVGEDLDSYGLCVTPSHFEEHLRVIRRMARPARIGEIADGVRSGRVPDRAVCVSFDDGYVDNLRAAAPILQRYDVPATVFVATGRGGRDREFWWDELERAFLEPARVPERLEMEIGGHRHAWDLGPDADRAPHDARWKQPWHLDDDVAPTRRHAAFRDAHALIKPLAEGERTRVLDALCDWSGIATSQVRPTRRAMTPDEVAELARGGLVDVGAHTVSHPVLPAQAPSVQREEIGQSKDDLEQWLGGPITGLAYPYGDYDDASIAAARDAGFEYACSCIYRAARRGDDPYTLPRVEVRDVTGEELANALRWHLR